jgi:hypothetical protein
MIGLPLINLTRMNLVPVRKDRMLANPEPLVNCENQGARRYQGFRVGGNLGGLHQSFDCELGLKK